MKNIYSIILFLLLTSTKSFGFPETIHYKNYKLLSLDNLECLINVKTDDVNDIITVYLAKNDSLLINGYRGFEQEIKNFNNNFLELRFAERGGSGVAVRRDLLICVFNNKLYKPMDIISMVSSQFKETYVPSIDSLNLYDEKSIYDIKIIDINPYNKSYHLTAAVYDMVKSKYDSTQNHEYKDTLRLSFDANNKIFYNEIDSLNGYYDIVDNNLGNVNSHRTFDKEKFYVICTSHGSYYYINHNWYLNGRERHLVEMN